MGEVQPDSLSGLELARYVLIRLTRDHETVKDVAKDFDDDERFVSGVADFLIDIKRAKHDENGTYRITRKGRNNVKKITN